MMDLREKLAAYAHEAWSGWMCYMFGKVRFVETGELNSLALFPTELAGRWLRQMETGYANLPEAEKASDRAEADKIIALAHEAFTQIEAESSAWKARAEALWQLLDDIDTLDDAAKSDDAAFRAAAKRISSRRTEHAESDGYSLEWKGKGVEGHGPEPEGPCPHSRPSWKLCPHCLGFSGPEGPTPEPEGFCEVCHGPCQGH